MARILRPTAIAASRIALTTIAVLVILTGCAARHYDGIEVGALKGDLIVEWRKPNHFVYLPSEDNPLRFTRGSNNGVIEPLKMWTDGGSIPRAFWVFRNYSPWGYGPAFIVHDWLFRMQHCEIDGYDEYDVKTAAIVMSEVMKTLMEQPDFDYGSKQSMYLMYKAVMSEPARSSWEKRDCVPVDTARLAEPDLRFTISFD